MIKNIIKSLDKWVSANGNGKYYPDNYIEKKEENLILEELSQAIPELEGKPQEMQLKKWLYAQPQNLLGQSYLKVNEKLYLTGDWCLNPRMEGAFLTGLNLAEQIF